MPGTISDWIIAAKQRGLEGITKLHTEKLEDYNRLKNSGLPIFDDLETPYIEFNENNQRLMQFLNKYPAFCIRALPNTKNLPRRFRLGIKSFEEAQRFLEEEISQENRELYKILISEYGQEEPTTKSGIIISRGDSVLIEIANIGLAELSHGEVDPEKIYTGQLDSFFKSMKYNTKDKQKRTLMWKALQYIREPRERVDFKKGYFEFVITDNNRIFFLDYKINPAYLS